MRKLTEQDIIAEMRAEWDARVARLTESLSVKVNSDVDKDGSADQLLSSGLKIYHKKSGLLYTVKSVSPRDAILTTPEGEDFMVDKHELEQEYTL